MTTHIPSQDEQPANAISEVKELQEMASPQPAILSDSSEEEDYFFIEEEQPDLVGGSFVAPFQLSGTMPPTATVQQSSHVPVQSTPVKKSGRKPHLSIIVIAILICVALSSGMLLHVLTQTMPPLHPMNGQGQGQVSPDWVPQQLPAGWTQAGLSVGDGLFALRTATTFTDREMSLDYRNIGTRNNHGGTFTAATFILTPAAQQRFNQNDARMINNTLFDRVKSTQFIRAVIDSQPQLVKFAQQGQQQFAWVNVSFQLWQSQIDPNNQEQRTEGKDIDPATHQPHIHHMVVLLLRVDPAAQGPTAPMGGSGWLVSNYVLDPANGVLADIVQPA